MAVSVVDHYIICIMASLYTFDSKFSDVLVEVVLKCYNNIMISDNIHTTNVLSFML